MAVGYDTQVVVKSLNFVCDVNPSMDHIATDTKLAFFNEARHAYGRTALLLSGGAGACVRACVRVCLGLLRVA
jgi:hypothetical protein